MTAFSDLAKLPRSRGNLEAIQDKLAGLRDKIEEAEGYAEDYELCLDDNECTAEDREEFWADLASSLEEISVS